MRSALLVEPDYHTAPAWTRTLGDEVGDLNAQIGYAPYPEQQLLLDDTFALDDKSDRSAAFEVGAVACRQNLKTGYLKQATLGWLFITDQQLIVWSAHEFKTSQEAFRDISAMIDGSAMLTRRVRSIYSGSGNEAIELMNGQRLIFKARTSGGGGKRRRNNNNVHPGHRAIQFRKTQVIANRQTDPSKRAVNDDDSVAGLDGFRFLVMLVAQIHPEQMDFVVACYLLAALIKHQTGIAHLIGDAGFERNRTANQPYLVLFGHAR